MKPRSVLVVHFQAGKVLAPLRELLRRHRIPATFRPRERLTASDVRGKDLVISVGGDGTFLAAAQRVEDAWMLGVNADPARKEGFLCRVSPENLEERFARILEDRFVVSYLSRLEASLDGKALPLALNEVFAASKAPQHMFVYRLSVQGKSEVQKSSGVIISTATGSNAWHKSAGGKALPPLSREFQYLVREPFSGRLMHPSLLGGPLAPEDVVEVESLMERGIAVVDSSERAFPFRKGSVLRIRISPRRLKCIEFPGPEEERAAQEIARERKAMPNVRLS